MIALQLWHCTLRRWSLPSLFGGRGDRAGRRDRSRSATLPMSRSIWYGDSVPQNGQTSFCLDGFHSACAPQAGQAYFSSAETSAARRYSDR